MGKLEPTVTDHSTYRFLTLHHFSKRTKHVLIWCNAVFLFEGKAPFPNNPDLISAGGLNTFVPGEVASIMLPLFAGDPTSTWACIPTN